MANDDLDPNNRDHAMAALRGAVSVVPFAGGPIAEAISAVVKEQRADRVVAYIRELASRLELIDRQINGDNPLTIDLLEDTVIQSSRAMSEDRNRYLAAVMADSADVSSQDYEFNKKLLQILEQLTDVDIDVLKAHTDFAELHQLQQRWPSTESLTLAERKDLPIGGKYQRESTKVAFDVHVAALERLGLLVAKRERPGPPSQTLGGGGAVSAAVRHLDDLGMPKITGYKVTTLGRLLLTKIFATYFD